MSVELPDPDAALLELDKLARAFGHYEYGLPFYAEGVLNNELPLSDYYSDKLVLDNLRDVMRAYARAAVDAALEAVIANAASKGWAMKDESAFEDSVRDVAEEAIRAMRSGVEHI